MTEAEWLASTELKQMLRFVRGKASDRRLRLFACACCRRVWPQIPERRSREAVEISERFADGKASLEELERAFSAAYHATHTRRVSGCLGTWHALDAARLAAHPEMRGLADGTASAAVMARANGEGDFWSEVARQEACQCGLLREVIGNPFHSVGVHPSWLRGHNRFISNLAEVIYEERGFDRLPILADALEDAGCDNVDILSHLRGPGPHVRGCWVIDLLLGKE